MQKFIICFYIKLCNIQYSVPLKHAPNFKVLTFEQFSTHFSTKYKGISLQLYLQPNLSSSCFFLFLGSFWCDAVNGWYRRLSATHLASPCFVVLVIIAKWRGRDQIWPISWHTYRLGSLGTSAESLHSFSHLFRQVTPQILRLDLQLEGAT